MTNTDQWNELPPLLQFKHTIEYASLVYLGKCPDVSEGELLTKAEIAAALRGFADLLDKAAIGAGG